MKETTRKRKFYKTELATLLKDKEEASKVENRYKVMAFILAKEYPHLTSVVSKETLQEFLKDTVYLDRQLRYQTEGKDLDVKLELALEVAEEIRVGNF